MTDGSITAANVGLLSISPSAGNAGMTVGSVTIGNVDRTGEGAVIAGKDGMTAGSANVVSITAGNSR